MSTYEREWFVYPEDDDGIPDSTRLHVGLSTVAGQPNEFLVQLEYWDGDTWLPVVRFDHEGRGPEYRDIERSGLHLDVYTPGGGQVEKVAQWPPQASNAAMGKAQDYIRENAEYYARRFESWL